MCRKRARILLLGVTGLELSRADFLQKELTFQVSCSYGRGRYDPNDEEKGQDNPVRLVRWTEQRSFEAVLDMMADGRLGASASFRAMVSLATLWRTLRHLKPRQFTGRVVFRLRRPTPRLDPPGPRRCPQTRKCGRGKLSAHRQSEEVPMGRLTIDMTEQQHQTLKAMAPLEGKSIKQFTLERLFGDQADEAAAFEELKQLLAARLAEAQRGEFVKESITEVAAQAAAPELLAHLTRAG